MIDRLADMGRLLLYGVALVVLVGAASHALGWLLMRRGTAGFVWRFWSGLGFGLLAVGLALIGYGWLELGLHTGSGSAVVGLGVLLASAGLWMIVPV